VRTRIGPEQFAVDQDFPRWVVASLPDTPDRTEYLLDPEHKPSPVSRLLESIQRLKDAGADFGVIACNTAYACLVHDHASPPLGLVDIVAEAVVEAAAQPDAGALGILATTGTLQAGLYAHEAAGVGVRSVSPLDVDPTGALQHQKVMCPIYDGPSCLKSGAEPTDAIIGPLCEVAAELVHAGATTIITGCTELSLVRTQLRAANYTVIDPLEVAARVAVAIALGERPLPARR
jgi:aspartate racemase